MTFRVNIRFGHLDRMPLCRHGRIEGYCLPCDITPDRSGEAAKTAKQGLAVGESGLPEGSS
jgi:hypothetical protein